MSIVILRMVDPCWMDMDSGGIADQCAHGRVLFEVDGSQFVRPEDGEWAMSAAGLYLLRTLEDSHSEDSSVAEGNLLFPCCGHAVFPSDESRYGLVIIGCPGGVHVEVERDRAEIRLRGRDGIEATVAAVEWKRAVEQFADDILVFYAESPPKNEPPDGEDAAGWRLFWEEWQRRRAE